MQVDHEVDGQDDDSQRAPVAGTPNSECGPNGLRVIVDPTPPRVSGDGTVRPAPGAAKTGDTHLPGENANTTESNMQGYQ